MLLVFKEMNMRKNIILKNLNVELKNKEIDFRKDPNKRKLSELNRS